MKTALRYVIFGGEGLEFESLRPWFERYGDREPQCVNMYGITETTVHVTYHAVTLADLEKKGSNIGTAARRTCAFTLWTQAGNRAHGEPGEMLVGGLGVARGYLNRPELTARALHPRSLRRRAAHSIAAATWRGSARMATSNTWAGSITR